MKLKIRLPFRIFADKVDVSSIVAETREGSFGILPHRLDCAAALDAGILSYTSEAEGTQFVALDGGVLVKTGDEVWISAHRAVGGADLNSLHQSIKRDFASRGAREIEVRSAVAKLEGGLMGRLKDLKDGR